MGVEASVCELLQLVVVHIAVIVWMLLLRVVNGVFTHKLLLLVLSLVRLPAYVFIATIIADGRQVIHVMGGANTCCLGEGVLMLLLLAKETLTRRLIDN